MASTKKPESFDPFEYVLNDFLEIKASVDPEKAKPLKDHLRSREKRTSSLSALEGFRLDGKLVLIENSASAQPTQVIFFNPEKGSIRIKEISS